MKDRPSVENADPHLVLAVNFFEQCGEPNGEINMTEKKPSKFFHCFSVNQDTCEQKEFFIRAINWKAAGEKAYSLWRGRVWVKETLKRRIPYGVKIIE